MTTFDDIQDVEAWLEPVGYAGFWDVVAPWALFDAGDRAHCDAVIAGGVAPETTVLPALKAMARMELTARLGLKDRIYEPVDRQYLRRTH